MFLKDFAAGDRNIRQHPASSLARLETLRRRLSLDAFHRQIDSILGTDSVKRLESPTGCLRGRPKAIEMECYRLLWC